MELIRDEGCVLEHYSTRGALDERRWPLLRFFGGAGAPTTREREHFTELKSNHTHSAPTHPFPPPPPPFRSHRRPLLLRYISRRLHNGRSGSRQIPPDGRYHGLTVSIALVPS